VLVTVAASLLPHGLKLMFDQTRPDRRTVIGHVHCVPFSVKRKDALGHALHMGALASAAGTLPAGPVVAGFALGAVLERTLRLWTDFPSDTSTEDHHAHP
jgi:hypothetical protein